MKEFLKIVTRDFFRPTRFKAFVLIAFLCLVVYFPSLFHVARGDQMQYLAEVSSRDDQSWVRLALKDFHLNRTRHFSPGDEALFRPGLYFMLGTERYLFGYDFKLWQAVGLLCHLTVIWWLLKVLWLIRPGWFACGCGAVFSVMSAHMEMVIWHHISAYMIFMALILAALYHLLMYRQARRWRHALACAMALGASLLFYETAIIFMFLAAGYAAWSGMERRHYYGLVMMSAILTAGYLTWSWMDLMATYVKTANVVSFFTREYSAWITVQYIFMALGWWFYSGLLPWEAKMHTISRMNAVGVAQPWVTGCWMVLGCCGMIVAWGAGVFYGMHRKIFPEYGKFMLLLGGMMVAVAAVIAFGRMQTQGPLFALEVGTYYAYFIWCLMFVLIVALVADLFDNSAAAVPWRWAAGCILAVALVVNIRGTWKYNIEYVKASAALVQMTVAMERFIAEHRGEKDFSFYVPAQGANYIPTWVINVKETGRQYSYVELLFPKYFKRDHPKYVLRIQ